MNLMKKKLNKKGFTLAELLIVVAIIAILAAIAIPVFSTQLDKSRKAVDAANARSITSMAVAEAMLAGKGGTYYGVMSASGDLQVKTAKSGDGYNQASQTSNATSPTAFAAKAAVYMVVVKDDFSIDKDKDKTGWVAK